LTPQVSRRAFLVSAAAVGGGLALGFDIPFGSQPARANGSVEVTAWVVINPDDTIVIRVARSEMGQGSFTALPMLVAEELNCDWSKVTAEFAPPHENLRRRRVWGDMSTGGSRSIRASHEGLRRAGATAREMLIAAAAARWNVPALQCRAANSVITHTLSGRTLTFGQVAEATARITPPADIRLKDPKDWTLVGTPQQRLDVPDKVQGKPIYGIDVVVPNMLHAGIVQCPVFKGTLKSVDATAARAMKGVRKVVQLPDAVAVVAESWWQAKKAVDALQVTWDEGPHAKLSSAGIKELLRGGLSAAQAGVGRKDGDVEAGLARAAKVIEAEYTAPFLGHATLEPQNCTAHVNGDKVEVWAPTQNGEATLAAAAAAAQVPLANVIVHKTMLGGGFGRRGVFQDFVRQAVVIAKEAGQPVKLIWSREEDTRHDYYRPVSMAKLTGGLDARGMPVAVKVRLSGHSIVGTLFPERIMMSGGVEKHFQEGLVEDMPYDFGSYLVDYAMRNTPVPVGYWRCVNHTQNCFFKESFVDELAYAAGRDPYQFRRALLAKRPKFLAVLDAAAKKVGWDTPPPAGVFRGIALEEAYDTYVAGVVEASVTARGSVKVHRVVCALDCGHVVNPRTVEMQIESGVAFALTAALYGEITIKDGRVEQSNFHDYEMLRMADMPTVESVVVPSGGFWGGCGEPPVAIVAPALCNAIFAATGYRVRSLPLKHHDLRKV
jgi:isoquinoline 1-oxidoreductase beta subunit